MNKGLEDAIRILERNILTASQKGDPDSVLYLSDALAVFAYTRHGIALDRLEKGDTRSREEVDFFRMIISRYSRDMDERCRLWYKAVRERSGAILPPWVRAE